MGIFSGIGAWISGIFKPAADLIDELHVSDEERGKLANEMARIQAEVHAKTTELMKSEAQSQHWITSAWRPISCLTLVGLILMDGHFGYKANEQVYVLAQTFLSVYGGGRSLEKMASKFLK